jgi:hypothetical protein
MRFDRFVKKIGRYRTYSLVEAIAREGAVQSALHASNGPHEYFDGRSGVTPWALTEIARESILLNVKDGRDPTAEDVRRLCHHYSQLDDPLGNSSDASLSRYLVRTSFEQFRWQMSEFEELSRSRALFVEAASAVPGATLFTEDAWRAATGYAVGEIVDVGFFLYVMAGNNSGSLDLSMLNDGRFEPLLAMHPYQQVMGIVEHLLEATPGEIRDADSRAKVPRDDREHRFNPLASRPIVRWSDGRRLTPHPLLLLQRVSPAGLYYDRCQEPGFTDQLGPVFEHYVGMQLDLIAGAGVHREIDLGAHGKSVDFIVVLPEVTLLVEAKTTRLTEEARAGLPRFDDDLDRTLVKAQGQIRRTSELIESGHAALGFVPRDRPVRGLVVTLEPYWLALNGFGGYKPTGPVVTHVASVRELEAFCASAQNRPAGELLLSLPLEHSHQVLAEVAGRDDSRNPILDRNWIDLLDETSAADS